MESLILLIALLVAVLAAYMVNTFVAVADPNVARRLENMDQPEVHQEPFEWVRGASHALDPTIFQKYQDRSVLGCFRCAFLGQ